MSHQWHNWHGLECCRVCGIVRRRDDKNTPCKGPTRIGPRGEGNRPRSTNGGGEVVVFGPSEGNSGAVIRWGDGLDCGVWVRGWSKRRLWRRWRFSPGHLDLGVVVLRCRWPWLKETK